MPFRLLLFVLIGCGVQAPSPALAKDPPAKKKLAPWNPDDVKNAPVHKTWKSGGSILRGAPEWEQNEKENQVNNDPAPTNERRSKFDPPKVVGPVSQRAAELSTQSRHDVFGLRDTTVTNLTEIAGEPGCNGAFCASSLETAAQATEAAQQLAASASQRQQAAEKEREQIFQGVQRGVREGQYSRTQAAELRRLFSGQARPSDQQIEKLHQKLQDPAHSLRTNGDELAALKATKAEFGEVAVNTAQMERKLAGISRRSGTVGRGQASSVEYPAAGASQARQATSSLAFRMEGKAASGSLQGNAEPSNAADPPTFSLGAPSPGLGAPSGAPARVSGSEPGLSRLGEDGTGMMAGLLQDLRGELAGPREPVAGALGAGKLGTEESGSLAGHDASLLGVAVRSVHAEAARGLREPGAQGSLAERALFGSPKSLFVRISEALKRKSARGGGLQ